MKKTLGGMHLRLMMRSKTQFQFFLTSHKKKMCQILTSTHTLNIFLQKAMNNMEESIKRGSNGSAKASYAVKIGQKQARRTENHHTQQKRKALEQGRQGGNLITNWFQPKGGPHTIHVQEDRVTYDQDPDITEMPASFPAGSTHPPSPKQPSNSPPKTLSTPETTQLSAGGIPPTLDEAR